MEIITIIEGYWDKLSHAPRHSPKEAATIAPLGAGVYCIWCDGQLDYAGETRSLIRRMRNLNDTRNHTFRRKVGHKILNFPKVTASQTFSPEHELELNEYMAKHYLVTFIEVPFGRKEVEDFIWKNVLKRTHGAKG